MAEDERMPRWPHLAVVLRGGDVLLGPLGIDLVRRAVAVTARVLQRDGIGMSPQLRELEVVMQAASSAAGTCSHACRGTAEPRSATDPAACATRDAVLDVSEVAEVLGTSEGYVRRLCRTAALESARQVDGRWLVDRVEVEAMAGRQPRNRRSA